MIPGAMRKDPDAILDYTYDWADWLAAGETITSHTITCVGVTKVQSAVQGSTVVARISGGTIGEGGTGTATATCHIVTSTGQEDDRTITFTITNR